MINRLILQPNVSIININQECKRPKLIIGYYLQRASDRFVCDGVMELEAVDGL